MPNEIKLSDVKITGGFFAERQAANRKVTIPAVYDRFNETGRVKAVKLKWREGESNYPHIFWDSDIAKWIEGAAYALTSGRDADLEKLIDDIVADIVKGQTPDGYFNSFYQTIEFSKRFTNRNNHELYCMGHLTEAAVAYHYATGKDDFLNAMARYADYIYDVFTAPDRDPNFKTPGHEEIELALVKLYHATGNKKYLELSKYFIDTRGTLEGEKKTFGWASPNYAQDHLPVAEQTTPEGHAVRCLYMFAGAADIAREYADDKLKSACEAVFKSTVERRMYVTGGIGGNHSGEAFSYDYDLPNELAYTETCASIALVYFAQRMYLLTGETKYIDTIELEIYNAILSGVSLKGDTFFYSNPLEVHPERRDYFKKIKNSQFSPDYERPAYFGCSCCPPNVIRLFASLQYYMYHTDGDDIYVNLFNTSEYSANGVSIKQETDYPRSGKVKLTVKTDRKVNIHVRIPEWLLGAEPLVTSSGMKDKINNYYVFKCDNEYKIEIDFPMPVVEIRANPRLHYCAGRIAVKRGPIVYCAESADNGGYLKSAVIKKEADYKVTDAVIPGAPSYNISVAATVPTGSDETLYSPASFETKETRLNLIPYAAWANRGKAEMEVWLLK
ncbi:hypothetical protein FACS1894105_06430 [Clostridia bacterium]|nr:hypothetical protein FACS1894105_06430 [Clostridia bacterium]